VLTDEQSERYSELGFGFRISPDGRRLGFCGVQESGAKELAIVDTDGSGAGFQVLSPLNSAHQLAWHPGSNRLLVSVLNSGTGMARLSTIEVPDRLASESTAENAALDGSFLPGQPFNHSNLGADWSPDGTQLVFASRPL
jgi:hypothetical protein